VTVPVTVTNSGLNILSIQADPRTTKTSTYQLTPTNGGLGSASPVQPVGGLFFGYQVPAGAKSLTVTSSSTVPTFLSLQTDPSLGTLATSDLKPSQDGNTISTARVSSNGTSLTPGLWDVSTSLLGPLTGSELPVDPSGIGADPYLPSIDSTVPWNPLPGRLLNVGESFTFDVTIVPAGKPGKVVQGVLNILTDDGRTVVAAMPYSYTIGAAH
jgi:hypothetical protein